MRDLIIWALGVLCGATPFLCCSALRAMQGDYPEPSQDPDQLDIEWGEWAEAQGPRDVA